MDRVTKMLLSVIAVSLIILNIQLAVFSTRSSDGDKIQAGLIRCANEISARSSDGDKILAGLNKCAKGLYAIKTRDIESGLMDCSSQLLGCAHELDSIGTAIKRQVFVE